MNKLITGIHHITALASDPQKNIDFYAGVLGLRLVKKTVNFDDPEVYHLYYGNETGQPGTIITFFPYASIPKGRKGEGQLTVTSFSIAENALDYWAKRLDHFHVPYQGPKQRFDETFIYLEDFDGLGLELVANSKDNRIGYSAMNISEEFAIKGFYGATFSEECYEQTAKLLVEQMDHQLIAEKGNRFRFSVEGKPEDFIDILCQPDALQGLAGYGTTHHIAFATPDGHTQVEARKKLIEVGLNVTPVVDREYFHSIYFREPGGVLFEIATLQPGFTVDEPLKHLGETLKLPPWQEQNRASIEKGLPLVRLDKDRFIT